jgi:hypothetical protein
VHYGELKAVIQMEDVYLAATIFEAYNVEIGLLINFGAKVFNLECIIIVLNRD